MGASTQFTARSNVEHAHGLTVLFTEQHHGACFLGRLDVHHAGLRLGVGQDFCVHLSFNLFNFSSRNGRVMRKVKTRFVGVNQRAFLLHMGAKHFAQGFVHQVGGGVVAHGCVSNRGIDLRLHLVANGQSALGVSAMVGKHIGFDFLGICHFKSSRATFQHALIADLSAAFCIERGGVQNNRTSLTSFEFGNCNTIEIQGNHFGG